MEIQKSEAPKAAPQPKPSGGIMSFRPSFMLPSFLQPSKPDPSELKHEPILNIKSEAQLAQEAAQRAEYKVHFILFNSP